MTEYRDRTFNPGETVDGDNTNFFNCTFNSATVRYSGGDFPYFEGCHFDNLTWYFDGPALRTIQLLQTIADKDDSGRFIGDMFAKGMLYGA